MGGGAGVLPVATTTRGARMRSPSTTTTPGSSNVASPITSRRPGSDSRYARAPFAPRSTMRLDAVDHRAHVHPHAVHVDAVVGGVPRLVGDLGAADERLAGDAAADGAGPADAVALDDRDARARPRPPGRRRSCRPCRRRSRSGRRRPRGETYRRRTRPRARPSPRARTRPGRSPSRPRASGRGSTRRPPGCAARRPRGRSSWRCPSRGSQVCLSLSAITSRAERVRGEVVVALDDHGVVALGDHLAVPDGLRHGPSSARVPRAIGGTGAHRPRPASGPAWPTADGLATVRAPRKGGGPIA